MWAYVSMLYPARAVRPVVTWFVLITMFVEPLPHLSRSPARPQKLPRGDGLARRVPWSSRRRPRPSLWKLDVFQENLPSTLISSDMISSHGPIFASPTTKAGVVHIIGGDGRAGADGGHVQTARVGLEGLHSTCRSAHERRLLYSHGGRGVLARASRRLSQCRGPRRCGSGHVTRGNPPSQYSSVRSWPWSVAERVVGLEVAVM